MRGGKPVFVQYTKFVVCYLSVLVFFKDDFIQEHNKVLMI